MQKRRRAAAKRWTWRPPRAKAPPRCAWSRIAGSAPRRGRLLHQLQQPQGRGSFRESARRARVSLALARAASAGRRPRREIIARGFGSIFSEPAAREPAQRVGVATKRDNLRTLVSRRRVRTRGRAIPRSKNSMPPFLGGLPNCRKLYRVLAGTATSTARSCPISQKRKVWTLSRLGP